MMSQVGVTGRHRLRGDYTRCCERTWDYAQSREGLYKIRLILSPLFLASSIVLLVVGAAWTKNLVPECGYTLSSAAFSIHSDATTGKRILTGNGCPGYNWSIFHQDTQSKGAGEHHFSYSIPLSPRLSSTPTIISKLGAVDGPIGVALNGVPIWTPSKRAEEYDHCGGSISPPQAFTFSVPIPGYYHYSAMPWQRNPLSNTLDLCPEISGWYNESSGVNGHSPLMGFMADGIPIYGPYSKHGIAPADLDTCNGHASDAHRFYHYHVTADYPYTVGCLKGCVDSNDMSAQLKLSSGSKECIVDHSVSYESYHTLQNFTLAYGGKGKNSVDWSGPASLLTFGFVLFLPSSMCVLCVCCCHRRTSRAKLSVASQEEFDRYDEHIADNIL
jgi:hypothetical protein